MEKSLIEFMEDNFETWEPMTDDHTDSIDVWNYPGDRLVLSIVEEEGTYIIRTWHNDNRSAKNEFIYFEPSEEELVTEVTRFLMKYIEEKSIR